MQKIAFFTTLLVVAVFVIPTYAEKPQPGPDQVEVVNTVDTQVTNTVDVNVMNPAENSVPVTVTNPSTGDGAIKGIARAKNVVNSPTCSTKYELVNLSGPGTFISAVVWMDTINGDDFSKATMELLIDGKTIIQETGFELESSLGGMSTFGVVASSKSLKIGFPKLVSESSVVLSVTTDVCWAIAKITGTVIYGE